MIQLEEFKDKINTEKNSWQKIKEILLNLHEKWNELPKIDYRFDKKKLPRNIIKY